MLPAIARRPRSVDSIAEWRVALESRGGGGGSAANEVAELRVVSVESQSVPRAMVYARQKNGRARAQCEGSALSLPEGGPSSAAMLLLRRLLGSCRHRMVRWWDTSQSHPDVDACIDGLAASRCDRILDLSGRPWGEAGHRSRGAARCNGVVRSVALLAQIMEPTGQ